MSVSSWLRRVGLAAAAVIVAAAMAAGGLMLFLHSDVGERWTTRQVEARVAGLALDGYHLGWPFRMRAKAVRLADGDGVWLDIDDAEMVWHPLRLWRRQLDIDRLAAAQIRLYRLPRGGGDDGGPVHLPFTTLRLGEAHTPIRLEAAVLGQPVDLDLAGTFRMRGGGGTADLSLRSPGGGFAQVTGIAATDYLDLRWYLRLPDLAAVQQLVGIPLTGPLSGAGYIVGRLPAPAISGRFDVGTGAAGRLGWGALAVSAQLVPGPSPWPLTAHAEMQRPSLDRRPLPAPALDLTLAGDLAADDGRLRLGHARLAGGGAVVEAAGIAEGWGRQLVMRLHGRADLAAMAGGSGTVAVRGIVAGDALHGRLDGQLRATASGAVTGVAMVDRLLGDRPRAVARAHLAAGRVRVDDARLLGGHGQLRASGEAAPRPDLWLRLALPELSSLAPGVEGSGHAWGRLRGTALAGLARLENMRWGNHAADAALAFDLDDLARPRGPLGLRATIAGVPVAGSTRLEVAQDIRLHQLELTAPATRLAGELAIGDGVRGRLSGDVGDLRAWEGIAGLPLAGQLTAEAQLDPGRGQSLRLSLRGHEVTAADLALPTLAADVEASGLRGGNGPVQVRVAEARTSLDGVALRLLQPAAMTWRDGVMTLPSAPLAVGGGRLQLSGQVGPKLLDAHARLEGVPLMLVRLAAPAIDAIGTLSGTVTATGSPAAPVVRFDLDGRDVGVAAAARAGLGRIAARLTGLWRDGRAQAQARLSDGDRLQAEAEGSLPVPGDGPLAVRFTINGDAGRLEALPLAGHVFAGQLEASGRVGGTMAAPQVTARADLRDGRYENVDNGTVVAALSATATIAGDRARLHAEGGDGGRGRMRLDGSGGLDGSYGADIAFDRFTALRRDDIEAAVTGTLRLQGQDGDSTVAGQLAVPRAEVNVGHIKGGGPVALDVVEINRPGPPPRQPPKDNRPAAGPLTVTLAVRVAVEHAFVRGRGLDSEWQGNLDVTGTATQPAVTGKLAAARGQFDFLGKPFKLTPDSTVTFEGETPGDPSLAVTAEAATADITARVEVGGTAHQPQLTVTSQPPLPQDEVLARLLFGREAGKLSAFQQVQLAQLAAGGLTGGGEGFDPIGAVRGFLGLDVLGVGSAEDKSGANAGPTLSAGKYIGPDTFVRVEQGTAGLGRVVVEQEVGRGFSLESSLGEQSGGGIGLNWRTDY